MTTGAILIIALIAFVVGIGIYNRLVALRNGYKTAFAQIEVHLKRRYDLIPNLVETAKGYMKHEAGTLEAVIKARNAAASAATTAGQKPGDATAMAALSSAEGALTGSLGKLFALSEAYPDLKANQNMMQLSGELANTENLIAGQRQAYNTAVQAYNTAREVFPNVIVANMFAFQAATLFEISNAVEREPVKVSF